MNLLDLVSAWKDFQMCAPSLDLDPPHGAVYCVGLKTLDSHPSLL